MATKWWIGAGALGLAGFVAQASPMAGIAIGVITCVAWGLLGLDED